MSPRKPRIITIARDHYPPFRVDITVLFSKFLSRQFELTWLMRRDDGGPSARETVGDETFHVAAGGGLGWLVAIRLHLMALLRIAKRDYDIVQCRDEIVVSSLYVLAAKASQTPFVYWMSFPIEESYLARAHAFLADKNLLAALPRLVIGHLGKFLLYHLTLPLADHVVVQSDRMKQEVSARGIAGLLMTPVPMGVDVDNYDAGGEGLVSYPSSEGKIIILYVGTLSNERRLAIPVDGVIRVMSEQPDVVFVTIGKASKAERTTMGDQFAAAGMSGRLVMFEHMPHQELLGYVKRADICLAACDPSPLLLVGTPTKLLEYLLMGRRIVANHHPDQDAVIGGAGLGVLTEFTAEGFAQGIREAMALGEPTELERRRAIDWLNENRSYRVLSARVAGIYDELLSQ